MLAGLPQRWGQPSIIILCVRHPGPPTAKHILRNALHDRAMILLPLARNQSTATRSGFRTWSIKSLHVVLDHVINQEVSQMSPSHLALAEVLPLLHTLYSNSLVMTAAVWLTCDLVVNDTTGRQLLGAWARKVQGVKIKKLKKISLPVAQENHEAGFGWGAGWSTSIAFKALNAKQGGRCKKLLEPRNGQV